MPVCCRCVDNGQRFSLRFFSRINNNFCACDYLCVCVCVFVPYVWLHSNMSEFILQCEIIRRKSRYAFIVLLFRYCMLAKYRFCLLVLFAHATISFEIRLEFFVCRRFFPFFLHLFLFFFNCSSSRGTHSLMTILARNRSYSANTHTHMK